MSSRVSFVLDSSVALAWFFDDENDTYAEQIAKSMFRLKVVVPSLWKLEIANSILVGERRGRSDPVQAYAWLLYLDSMRIRFDDQTTSRAWSDTIALARAKYLGIRRILPRTCVETRSSARHARLQIERGRRGRPESKYLCRLLDLFELNHVIPFLGTRTGRNGWNARRELAVSAEKRAVSVAIVRQRTRFLRHAPGRFRQRGRAYRRSQVGVGPPVSRGFEFGRIGDARRLARTGRRSERRRHANCLRKPATSAIRRSCSVKSGPIRRS